jgi:hypothetical protein
VTPLTRANSPVDVPHMSPSVGVVGATPAGNLIDA